MPVCEGSAIKKAVQFQRLSRIDTGFRVSLFSTIQTELWNSEHPAKKTNAPKASKRNFRTRKARDHGSWAGCKAQTETAWQGTPVSKSTSGEQIKKSIACLHVPTRFTCVVRALWREALEGQSEAARKTLVQNRETLKKKTRGSLA